MEASVGVIVARFQTPYLHHGHASLIERVLGLHQEVLVILGQSAKQLSVTDPLDVATRTAMVHEKYPHVMVVSLKDSRSDQLWSQRLDALVAERCPGKSAVLYGSRQSFLAVYSGHLPTVTLESVEAPTGTDLRDGVGAPLADQAFRQGVIYACKNRFPIAYPTVDIAVIDYYQRRILLGMRREDGSKLRFIGGFVGPKDESLERAAKREVIEETSFIETDDYTYLGSIRVNDWRYQNRPDGIMTSFFAATYIFGAPRAADDLEGLEWVRFDQVQDVIVSEHQPLAAMLTKHLAKTGVKTVKEEL